MARDITVRSLGQQMSLLDDDEVHGVLHTLGRWLPLRSDRIRPKAVIGCLKSRGGIHSRTTMIKKHYGKLIPSNAKQMTSHVSEPMGFGKG